ncbi:MAG TPA: CzcE family metal-binding protein [Burkholderiales bacterium]|nr:CzcE family metal-binding protein [Burkholderiales bacterium]
MKLLIPGIAALALSAASLSANATSKPAAILGEPVQPPSAERAIITALADRTITIGAKTKWVNVEHFEVVRFVSKGREFTWYFDGTAQSLDLAQLAPADFLDHPVTVYVSIARDF